MKKGIFTRNLQGDSGNAYKTRRITFIINCLLLTFLFLVSNIFEVNAQVTYTLGNTGYYTTFYDASPGAGSFANSGTAELGMYANTNGNKQSVVWRNFKTAGDNTGSTRSLQVGDIVTMSVYATAAFGSIGFSLNATAANGSWANRISNSRLYIDAAGTTGSWNVHNSAGSTSLGYSVSSTGHTYMFKIFITSYTTCDVELFVDGTFNNRLYNLTMNGAAGANIDGFSLFLMDDFNGSGNSNIYWKQTFTHNANGSVNLGYYSSSGTYTPGLISDGTTSSSTSTTSSNVVNVGGAAGTKVFLNQTNSYTGITTVYSDATLQLGNSQALGTTDGITSINSGGAIDMNGTNYSTSEALTINGTGVSSSGALYNSSSSAATYAGLLTLGSASTINGSTGTIALSNIGTITGSGFGITLGGGVGGSVASVIGTGSGTLTKADAGTWTLSAVNTYTGATSINGGTLKLDATGGALKSGNAVTIGGGTLEITQSQTIGNLTMTSGTLKVDAGQTLTITGTYSVSGGTIDNQGTIILQGVATQTFPGSSATISNMNSLSINNSSGVTLDKALTVSTLTLTSGTLTNSTYLTLANAATVVKSDGILSAVPTFGSSVNLTYNGSNALTPANEFPASTTITTLTVNNTAGLSLTSSLSTVSNLTINASGILNVSAGKQLTVNTTLTNGGTLNLLSTSGGTATILTPTTIAAGGTYNVYQYLSKSRNWYMSSPVSGATASVVDPAGSSNLLYLYNETLGGTNGWTAITSNATALTPGHGYVVKPAADGVTLNFTGGQLNTGTTPSFTVSSTAAPDHAGYNLIGNPYPSYLYASTLVNSTANLDKSIWYRTQKNATTTFYFDTYNTAGKIGTNNSANVNYISGTVAPMQSFWVHVSTALSSASINFNNSYRTHATALNDTVNPLKVKNQFASLQPALRLQVSNGINSDETLLYTNPNALNGYDAYDSQKMSNGSASIPEIYTQINTEQLAINGMNAIPVDTEMPLGFTTGTAGTFSIKASQISNFVVGTKLILKDYLDINNPVIADLSDGSSYSFSSGITSNNTSRFALIFKAPSVTTALNDNASQKVWVSVNGANQIVVNGNSGIESTVAVYNALGQKLLARQLSGNTTVLNNSLGSGVYFVTVDLSGNKITKKVIINE
ncbi:MAG: autotransporter-associated beta strand repeat-containing protein [Paludibacter sp.]